MNARSLAALAIPLLITFAYVLPQPYFERLNNPNENVRVYLTRAIVEHHTLSIDPIVAEWGYVNDKAIRDGRLYAGKAPGTSMLAVPGWFVWHHVSSWFDHTPSRREAVLVCRYAGTILPVLLGLLAFARWLPSRVRDPATRDVMLVALACGSTFLPYGLLFASHTLVAVFVLGTLMAAEWHGRAPHRLLPPLLAGHLAGWAICCEYPALFGAALAALWGLRGSPRPFRYALLVVIGGLIPAALLAGYHHAAFGSALQTAYDHLENPDFRESHSAGFYGLERVQGHALWGSFFAPSNGLFYFVPWTIAAVLALALARPVPSLRAPAALTAASLVCYALFVSMVDNWRGGWTAGPRYIVPVIPFLAWYLALALDALATTRHAARAHVLVGALVLVSTLTCGLSAVVFPHYPENIVNPIHEIGLWLPRAGFYPETVLSRVGLDLRTAFFLTVAMGPVAALLGIWRGATIGAHPHPGPIRGAWSALTTVVLVVGVGAFLASLMTLPQSPRSTRVLRERAAVLTIWDPAPTEAWADLRRGRLGASVVQRAEPSALRDAATAAAWEGWDESAAALHAAVWHRRAAPDATEPRTRAPQTDPPPHLPTPAPPMEDEAEVAAGPTAEESPSEASPAGGHAAPRRPGRVGPTGNATRPSDARADRPGVDLLEGMRPSLRRPPAFGDVPARRAAPATLRPRWTPAPGHWVLRHVEGLWPAPRE